MIKKIFIFCILVFFTSQYAFSEDILSELEYSKYGTNYEYQSLAERLNRLETDYFGMSQTGDIDSRIENLLRINKNSRSIVSFPQYNNHYNSKQKNFFRNFWNNITSDLSNNGYITGYTPSMNTFSSSGYGNNFYENNFNNYLNNPHSFCPYNSGFHNRTFFKRNGYFNNRSFNPYNQENRLISDINNNRNYPHNRYYNMPVRPYINRTSYYSPPDIQTQSSIYILKD